MSVRIFYIDEAYDDKTFCLSTMTNLRNDLTAERKPLAAQLTFIIMPSIELKETPMNQSLINRWIFAWTVGRVAVGLFVGVAFNPGLVHADNGLQLNMALSNANPVVTWNNTSALLQSAPSVTGSWNTMSNTASPYQVPATNSAAFFRLRVTCVAPPSGIVSWWPGDGTTADVTGTNNGILKDGATFAAGKVGQAFSLDGVSNWVDIPSSDLLNPTGPFSVECWIKASPQQNFQQVLIVDKSHGFIDGTGWGLQTVQSGNACFFYGVGGTASTNDFPIVVTANSVLDDQWHHLAGTWTGTQLQIYEDGVLQGTLNQTYIPSNNSRDAEIGRSWGGGTPIRFFHGLIDEVTYYNRSLSSNEVTAIFDAGAAGKCKP